MSDLLAAVAGTVTYGGQTSSAQAWFSAGERVGYDPRARAIVTREDAPLRIFLRREGDLAQAVSFLPGFPDGSFGWAKVRPHLPKGAEMPKLFLDYVGMGDSKLLCEFPMVRSPPAADVALPEQRGHEHPRIGNDLFAPRQVERHRNIKASTDPPEPALRAPALKNFRGGSTLDDEGLRREFRRYDFLGGTKYRRKAGS